AEEWIEVNFLPVVGISVTVAVLQVLNTALYSLYARTFVLHAACCYYLNEAFAVFALLLFSFLLRQKHADHIHHVGCLAAAEHWFRQNLLFLVFIMLMMLFIQILGICFAQNLRADVFAQKAKWH
ncbi:tetraspanin-14-like isoform X1, partial [Leptotrombidium deliense]